MTCPFCNSAEVLPTKYTQEYQCGTFMSRCKFRKSKVCSDNAAIRSDIIKDLLHENDALRQNRDDWKRCAEMFKAALEPENCPEGGEAFGDVEKSARGLFDSLTEEPVNVEGEMP